MSDSIHGHPYLDESNHASKGIKKSMELGGGGKFQALKGELASKGATDPAGLAAYIGQKKYGKKKMASMAKHGRSK